MTTAERYRLLAELIIRRELVYAEAMGQQYITDDTISRAATALREAAEMREALDMAEQVIPWLVGQLQVAVRGLPVRDMDESTEAARIAVERARATLGTPGGESHED